MSNPCQNRHQGNRQAIGGQLHIEFIVDKFSHLNGKGKSRQGNK